MDDDKILLSEMKTGSEGKITNFLGGSKHRDKLNSLGLRKGKKIKVISNMAFNGPITVDVGYSRIAVGRGMASKVLVKKITK
ncbi:MAG: FeoA family protein [Bacillota bacterium]